MNTEFGKELRELINKHSKENGSNTPDFVLAQYLISCLENFDFVIKEREKWYGREYIQHPSGLFHSAEIVHKKG